MGKLTWKPWHDVVSLRDDLKSGELSLSIFAADLYDVVMGQAKSVYQDPIEFFSYTYPTYNLRELVKDVLVRLRGLNDKAVRQLELTYGGGKTHTLITLYHLVSDPAGLPDLPAVREFIAHAGTKPPKARVATLAFDKIDAEKGTEVKDPDGNLRWLRHPWSVLAWQIAGEDGIRLLNADGEDEERESPPAENLLLQLLAIPDAEGLATLILIDEVLMYARQKVGLDPVWRWRLQDFFQALTQAATKVGKCAIVASLLASDPRRSDALGKEISKELYDVFRREQEEGVQPVEKSDVAEVLRRRFFKPESTKDREAFRPHVARALAGITALDEETKREEKSAEQRYIDSYPFHPDLTEVLYTKWTQLEGFQRTRGVLRTFAAALRDAAGWNKSPLVGANVFLSSPGAKEDEVSDAARELTNIAASEEYEGKRQEWAGILQGELSKARSIQKQHPGLRHREIEQAVLATFIHSQPVGQKASLRDLSVLLGQTRPDKIELEKALGRWTETSWFLDEASLDDVATVPDGQKGLPRVWRLGSKPNLTQMHSSACANIGGNKIRDTLLAKIRATKSLTAGAGASGARVHILPSTPNDIPDDGHFHYAVLGPDAACGAGSPSALAKRFLDETTGPDKPRVYRNAVVLAVPSPEGRDLMRTRVRDFLGWVEVRASLEAQEVDPARAGRVVANCSDSEKLITEAVRQAYGIAVTVSKTNEAEALRLTGGSDPLFDQIKRQKDVRIQETALEPRALLPEGPYGLWKEGETYRTVKDLVSVFAQAPRLPKMLKPNAILDTLAKGARDGCFVLQVTPPDKSRRTIWCEDPTQSDMDDPTLELVLPGAAVLTTLRGELLLPGELPGMWPTVQDSSDTPADAKPPVSGPEVRVADIFAYFAGGRGIKIDAGGWFENLSIPEAPRGIVEKAISEMVEAEKLWLISGLASIMGETVPAGVLTDESVLRLPPRPISALEVLPPNLPDAWRGQEATAQSIAFALSHKEGINLPWVTVRKAIDDAIRVQYLELMIDGGPWPCGFGGAGTAKLQVKKSTPDSRGRTGGASGTEAGKKAAGGPLGEWSRSHPGAKLAEARLEPYQVQDLADVMSELVEAAVGMELEVGLQIGLGGLGPVSARVVAKVNSVLAKVAEGLKME